MSANHITPPLQGPWVDIDLGNLCENFSLIRSAASDSEVAAVVKCNAYGLGLAKIAQTLADRAKCKTFFVVYPEEGAALRNALGHREARIFCFAGQTDQTLALFDQAKLIPVLNTLEQAQHWADHCSGREASIHVETGMNRIGADFSDLAKIASLKNLNVKMVMTHLACASDPDHPLNSAQREKFIAAATHFPDTTLSLGASAGALMGREYQFDLVRAGIALYGGAPFDEDDTRIKPVASLRAPIVQLRNIAPGDAVGYGATYIAKKPSVIATVAAGYGDGYPRNGSPVGNVSINGERAPIAGRISMDFITIDVSDLKKRPELGDSVEFFGSAVRIHEAAQTTNRVSYDLLTGLGGRVDRRYL
ncbi:alanine racemase [Hyphococcus lacteus]|uniref:Alanine racemase n=1 Tax=Hyphococcus lacteus TaxID=3143536 RepID=A0ABV3Z4R4_9PROT